MKIMLLAIIGLSLMSLFIWIIVRSALKLIESALTPLPLELQLMRQKHDRYLNGTEMMLLIELALNGMDTKEKVLEYFETNQISEDVRKKRILVCLLTDESQNKQSK